MHSVAVMLALGAGVLSVSLATPLVELEDLDSRIFQIVHNEELIPMESLTADDSVPIFVETEIPSPSSLDLLTSPEGSSSGALPPMSRQKRQILGGGLGAGMAGAQAQSQAQSMGGGMGLGGMGGMGFPYMMGMPFMG